MYLWVKLLHVAAVIIFLGNIATGLFWKAHADRSRDPRIIAHTMDGIIRSDRLFTIPGVVLIIVFGVTAAIMAGLPLLRVPWIAYSLLMFAISGVVFVLRVAPLQRKLLALAQRGIEEQMPWDEYTSVSRAWLFWGDIALLTPIIALALMVLKPGA